MASLGLSFPPAAKTPTYLASSSSTFFSNSSLSIRTSQYRSRNSVFASVKCDMPESLNVENGNPSIPIINERTLPKFLESARMEKSVSRTSTRLKLFSGTANPALAQEIAWYMGLELGKVNIKRFADGEIYVQLQESVRGCDVYLVQPTCTPTNENLMELLIMVDACRRASAKKVTAVIPYFGYARADRKTQGRESIAAKLVANLITEAGADRVLACDLHSGQSMGYFDIPVDHVYCQPVILDYLASKSISSEDLVVVSPDVGGVARARAFAKKLSDAPLAIVDKRRSGHNVAEVMNLIGDVKGKVAVMVDDMIDTAGTIVKGAALLHQEGAREVYACCTHAVFSPPAIERLSGGLLQEVIVTNTLPVAEKNYFPQLTILSVANLLGETIWRVHDDSSVSSIFL
ncbi:Ribose-phosphate pyrophosphokinase [Arabidopsis thaliana x Arabidopsis arenosa]|uniref:ribose-phosphate diphosphokinase n=2 Tax=Arabidopsis thaliana x Arabidopsis arenosa TaxID=1240361 RepID=A0A8T2AC64_9BRAS|nr:Ribose-phosphate pyrophosphokinase [Arabidopsis thaliana x Arabidopsis arenosa]